MEHPATYIPLDRRRALLQDSELPSRMQGATMFADISGFTPLTAAFARHFGPKRGAEEMTRYLNMVYDALISQVDYYDGSVVGFAGDGITCWFDGDTGLRAIACALAMQHAMEDFKVIPLASGETGGLAMKVGIATGVVRRFLVGDPQIQVIDVLGGSTLDRMAAAEHLAEKGEIILDGEDAARLAGKLQIAEWRSADMHEATSPAPQYAVVRGLTTPLNVTPPETLALEGLREEQVRPWLLPTVYKRLAAGQEIFLAELRPTVALFLRFTGIDYDNEEDAGGKLDAFIRWVQSILAHYEGSLLQLTIGDKGSYLYATFGAPIAHPDDTMRAVLAALELRTPPPELSYIQRLQIGMSQGQMRTGSYGGATRRTYGVLGDEVNLAARLMQKAAPGTILASQRVWQATATELSWGEPVALTVKGLSAPLMVAELKGIHPRAGQRIRVAQRALPLLGREAEITFAKRAISHVRNGRGKIIGICGESGIGKTRLVEEIIQIAQAESFVSYEGFCQSYGINTPYLVWRPIWRSFFGIDAAWPVEVQAEVLEQALAQYGAQLVERLPLMNVIFDLAIPETELVQALDAKLRKESLEALLIDCLVTRAKDGPLLLVLEDCHWIDPLSHDLLEAVSRAITQLPVLIVASYQPPELERIKANRVMGLPHATELRLAEFTPQEAGAMILARLAQAAPDEITIPDALIKQIIERAQGNPFYIEELISYLQDQRYDWRDTAEIERIDLPTSLQRLILSRIDVLDEEEKVALKVASVIGQTFDLEVLAQTHPQHPQHGMLRRQISALEKHEFALMLLPVPRVTYVFKHNLTREVAYGTLLEAQRRQLHRAVAEALERLQPEAVEQLAYHYRQSGMQEKALYYLDKAARKAQREYANEAAVDYYTQALLLEERWEWRKGQVEVFHILGRREEEQKALTALEDMQDAPVFEVAYLWGQYYEAIGDYAQAQAQVERALATCRDQEHKLNQMRCLSQLGLIARRQGDYEQARGWYDQALRLYEEQKFALNEISQTLAQILNGLGSVHRQQGEFEEAKRCFEQALELSRQQNDRKGEAEALNYLGGMAYYRRQFTQALEYHRQALELRRAIGDRAGEGISLFNLGTICSDAGDYSLAQSYFSAALAIQQAIGNRWEEINIWNGMGIMYQELGVLSQAQQCLQQGLALSKEIGDEGGQVYILANLGLVVRDQGDLEAAEAILSDGLAIGQAQFDRYAVSYFLSHLAVISLLAGRPEQAIERANAALALRREIDLRLWTTADLSTLAAAYLVLGHLDQALQLAAEALTILNECGGEGPEFPHRDYFICYQVLAAAAKVDEAREVLQSAYTLIQGRAEKIADPALRDSFLMHVPINQQIIQEAKRIFATPDCTMS
ncbi:MAG: adenylyl cyclase [Herpetosiphonaceae bacterium]|nr:MAG: adenylyl cyclase [Herpetosiphonaceae bacterium]